MKTRGSGGNWEAFNIMPLCRSHHIEQGRRGMVTFFKRYPQVQKYLENKGWKLEFRCGQEKLWHDNLNAK